MGLPPIPPVTPPSTRCAGGDGSVHNDKGARGRPSACATQRNIERQESCGLIRVKIRFTLDTLHRLSSSMKRVTM